MFPGYALDAISFLQLTLYAVMTFTSLYLRVAVLRDDAEHEFAEFSSLFSEPSKIMMSSSSHASIRARINLAILNPLRPP